MSASRSPPWGSGSGKYTWIKRIASEPSGSVSQPLGRGSVGGPARARDVEPGRVAPGLQRPVEVAPHPVADVGGRQADHRIAGPRTECERIAGGEECGHLGVVLGDRGAD